MKPTPRASSDNDVLCSERHDSLACIGGELFRGESLEPT